MNAVAEQRAAQWKDGLYFAHANAVMGRMEKIPAFADMVPPEDTPELRDARAGERRAYLTALSRTFRKNGQERTWAEWQRSRA